MSMQLSVDTVRPIVEAAPPPPLLPLAASLRGPILTGTVIIGLFFVGLGGWSVLAPLSAAAIAHGVVSPDGSRRTVQHLEGGIIAELLVRDGSVVVPGEPMVVLEDTQARAAFEVLANQRRSLSATQARLIAEQRGAPTIDFPAWLAEEAATDGEAAEIVNAQVDLFDTRRATVESQKSILRQQIAQYEEEIVGLHAQIDSQSEQLTLIEEEVEGVEALVTDGLERRPRLLALQRSMAQIEGLRSELQARIARARQAIGEAELEILDLDTKRREEVNSRLTEVQDELGAVVERLASSSDILARTQINAPIGGTIVQLRYKTIGGVIGPGQPILDIVPNDEDLLIDARVSPTDIDVVHQGLPAHVILSAYKQRNLPRIEGTVLSVSADAIPDEQSGRSYYLARVEVDRDALRLIAPDIELTPGMPAEVMIKTSDRTAFDYFIGPFIDSLRRSFREE